MRILSRLSLLTLGIVLMSSSGVAVVAAEPSIHADAVTTTTQTGTDGQSTDSTTNDTNSHDGISNDGTRLAAAKLRACQNREKAINNILSHIASRGQKQLDLFSSIATKTEAFYTAKGKTLSNYDALVADVNAKQTAAQTAVNTVKSDSVTFKCDGTDPKGAAASFKTALKSEIAALKEFKTAVKNLIAGVKSVQGTTSTDNKTGGSQQ